MDRMYLMFSVVVNPRHRSGKMICFNEPYREGRPLVYRRHPNMKWLRPYNEMIVGTWSVHIRLVNQRMRPKKRSK
jgi:hypothetical protein